MKNLFIIFFILVLSSIISAEVAQNSLEFLKIPVSARAAAMGYAFSAVEDDANCIFWNPAGIAVSESSKLSISHTDYLLDMNFKSMSCIIPSFKLLKGTVGFGLNLFDAGKFKHTIMTGATSYTELGLTDAQEYSANLSYGAYISEDNVHHKYGVTAKYISSRLEDVTVQTFAADIGYIYSFSFRDDEVNFGATVQNIGSGVKYIKEKEDLPLLIRCALNGTSNIIWNKLDMSFNIETIYDVYNKDIEYGFGFEYNYRNRYFFRGGYNSIQELDNAISIGVGFQIGKIIFDYAAAGFKEMGDVHRISLSYTF